MFQETTLPTSIKMSLIILSLMYSEIIVLPRAFYTIILPKVVTAGGQNSFVNLKALFVDGEHHVQQLALLS